MGIKTLTADDQFLKDTVAARASVQPQTPDPTAPVADDTTFLADNTPKSANQQRIDRLQDRAERLKAANQARLDKEQKAVDDENAAKAKEEADKKKSAYQRDLDASREAVQVIHTNVSSLADKIGSIQTVGGIGLLVIILALLLFTIVQVNAAGDTRLKQLWYMLNGRATLQGSVTPSGVFAGAGTSFGPGATTTPGPTTSTATTATGGTGGGPDSLALYTAGYTNGSYRSSF